MTVELIDFCLELMITFSFLLELNLILTNSQLQPYQKWFYKITTDQCFICFLTKGAKKAKLAITSTQRIAATDLPEGSVFKGYKKCIRQELQIQAATICYELERWQAPNSTFTQRQAQSGSRPAHRQKAISPEPKTHSRKSFGKNWPG
ncbi:MAG: hypothetical protein AAF620_03955 [Bacteroidota bacterium]